jgi:hypothetical protein
MLGEATMGYRRRAAAIIAAVTLLTISMEFSEELLPGLTDAVSEQPRLRPTASSMLALVYAGLIAFNKSLAFKPTTKKWKRLLLVFLAVVGVIFIVANEFTVSYVGFVLSGLTFPACLLWFDSDVRDTQDVEQDLSAR